MPDIAMNDLKKLLAETIFAWVNDEDFACEAAASAVITVLKERGLLATAYIADE